MQYRLHYSLYMYYHEGMHLRSQHSPFLVLLVLFVGIFLWGLSVGMLGHDYFYFFPKLLDGKWHFLRQGFAAFEYTAHFCGGFPEYANPQSLYYSLPQALSLFLDLWVAARISIVLMIIAGYAGWYRFGRDVITLTAPWSHVFALVIAAHGFHFLHQLAGHIVFHTMPLIGWMLWILFAPGKDSLKTLLLRASVFALLSALIMHSGGYMVMIMLGFAVLSFLPFLLGLSALTALEKLQVYGLRLIICGISAMIICSSKIVAVLSFVRYFPRELPPEPFPAEVSTLAYIAQAFWHPFQSDDLYWKYGMPNWGAVHEYSMFISPITVLGLVLGIFLLWRSRTILRSKIGISGMLLCVTVIMVICIVQLTQSHGVIFTFLKPLPVMKALHVNMRYLYAFSFPLIALALWCTQRFVADSRFAKQSTYLAFTAGVITLVAFPVAYWSLLHGETLPRTMPYDVIQSALRENPNYLSHDVQFAYDMRGLGHSGFVPLLQAGNHIYCSEPMLLGSSSLPHTLLVGPVAQIHDDAYNLYNPACMVYPEENTCEPGDRIQSNDKKNFGAFVSGEATDWKVSTIQSVADVLSLFMLISSIIAAIYGFWLYKIRK